MCNLLSARDQVPIAVCSPKSASHPSFDASVKICVMAGLEVSFLLEATISDEGGLTLGWGSPFLEILVPQLFFKCHCIGFM